MARFIYARTAANDAICLNIEKIIDISISADDTLLIEFEKSDGGAGSIALDCVASATDAQEKSLLLEVTNAIAGSNVKVITLKDDVTGEGFANILTVGTIAH
tara:strand:- start:2226 stop:2531 length:306 start_codon:yes stop_codon:yes gene_type:complete